MGQTERSTPGKWPLKALAVLALFALVLAWVFVPVYHDRQARNLAVQGIAVGADLSDRLLAHHAANGHWPRDSSKIVADAMKSAPAHVDGVVLVNDGLIRVGGKSVEIETVLQDAKYHRSCRGVGLHPGLLPGNCRPGAQPVVLGVRPHVK